MASVSATCLRFGCSLKTSQISGANSGLKLVSVGWAKSGARFPSLRTSRFQVSCAKAETVEKVISIVRKQLALTADTEVSPETTFNKLGADSLDTQVEIVMVMEEEFGIAIKEENSESILTVQDTADLIEKLVEKNAA